ncbi:MAG: class Ib ribonucleoside-diphosphate reductase assembly flavoprotein NrdI [Gorillibacterium sp.]|nr:class Ib ribonucleoside-diphosphate reductase assembly flavoprotein NrdI [Gorillibacterium sp.]
MLVAYDSKTGNVRRFVEKLNRRAVQIEESLTLFEPFVFITYTTGFGKVPPKSLAFLELNGSLLLGVAASGNRNWGNGFAKSADTISSLYNTPVLYKFELSGTSRDLDFFQEELDKFELYPVK